MVAAWLKREEEATLKKFYREGSRVRLQPANSTMEPIYTDADNVEIHGKVVLALRRTYADAAVGEAMALVGSSGLVEIAVRDGSAAEQMGLKRGSSVALLPVR